jgi:hypothetical protein
MGLDIVDVQCGEGEQPRISGAEVATWRMSAGGDRL